MTTERTPPPPPVEPRPVGRPPRFRREDIVVAGLALVAEHGIDGLGVRRLAELLETTPATLYRHVGTQEQLVAAVADAVVATIEAPPPPAPGELRSWLIDAAGRYREAMLRYPGVADYLLLRGPTGPAGLAGMAEICDVLARTGRSPRQVAWAYDWLMTTVSAYTAKEDRLGRAGGAHPVAEALAERAKGHDDSALIEILGEFTGDMSSAFERSTALVIDAILAVDPPRS
ncbi:MAG: TetR/AcrR family transcriptional regulator [Actinomycetota bacterium]